MANKTKENEFVPISPTWWPSTWFFPLVQCPVDTWNRRNGWIRWNGWNSVTICRWLHTIDAPLNSMAIQSSSFRPLNGQVWSTVFSSGSRCCCCCCCRLHFWIQCLHLHLICIIVLHGDSSYCKLPHLVINSMLEHPTTTLSHSSRVLFKCAPFWFFESVVKLTVSAAWERGSSGR